MQNEFSQTPQVDDIEFSTQIAKLSGDMKANLAVLIEKGLCKVSSTSSLVVMPSLPDYSSKGNKNLEPLPQSAKDIYFKQNKKTISTQDSDFFDDNWYFIELHQSILQESTQNK
eukprot:gene8119-12580_t